MFRSPFILLFIFNTSAYSQKYSVEKSDVVFFSSAAIEDITAGNTKSVGLFNAANSDIAFSIPISEFQFEKSLMKEHFNERYMDTEKYPKSTFQGRISGYDSLKAGVQNVKATGKLNIHGVTRTIDVPGTIEKQGTKLNIKSKFLVRLKDHKIKIPQLMWQNIAEEVEVSVDFTFKPQ